MTEYNHLPYVKESLVSYWDDLATDGNTYQHGLNKHRQHILDLIKETGVKSVLDIGCGTGPIWELIKEAKIPVDYKGVDYSKGYIDIAKKHAPEGNFEVQDARELKEPDGSHDFVLIMHCLDHVDDWRKVISEAARVSSKFIQIVLWRPFLNEDNIRQIVMGETLFPDTFLHEFKKEEVEEEFKKLGLGIVHQHEVANEDGHYNYCWFLKK